MKNTNVKETGITLIALIITVILMLILAGVVISLTIGKSGIIEIGKQAVKDYKAAEIKEKNDINSISDIINNPSNIKVNCKYLDNQNEKEIKVLLTINSEEAIEYIELPNGMKIYGKGRKEISIDYIVENEKEYIINIKGENGDFKKETLVVNYNDIQEYVESKLIEINVVTNEEEYNSLKITEKLENNNFSYFYRTDEKQEWVKYTGKNVVSSKQNDTPIYIRVVNDITDDRLEIHKNIRINNDRLYLYYYGAEFEDVTGGWTVYNIQSNGRAVKNDDNMLIYYSAVHYSRSGGCTNNVIELSNYKKLHVKYSKENAVGNYDAKGLYICGVLSENYTNGDFSDELDLNNMTDMAIDLYNYDCYDYIYEVYLTK